MSNRGLDFFKEGKKGNDTTRDNIGEVAHPKGYISKGAFDGLRDVLARDHSELVWQAFGNDDAKNELKKILMESNGRAYKEAIKNEDNADYFLSELVGLGLFDELIKEPGVTDIGYNGSKLVVQTNSRKYIYGEEVNERYINKLIEKMANGLGKSFSPKAPILDGVFKNYRINAVHSDLSPDGTTMALRVSHKKMMLNQGNFENFAPMYVYDLFENLVKAKCNILISGQTGTGKTELQKLLVSFIPFQDKICMIEDVQESHVKELFPEKDILSWVTGHNYTIADFVKVSLRNNPEWVIVSETRGSEAYEMFQAVLSGSYIITTLHAPDARKVPDRFVNMITDTYQNANEERLEKNILENFDIGVHIEYIDVNLGRDKSGKMKSRRIRYAAEIVEYNLEKDGGIVTLLKQRYSPNGWIVEPQGDLSDAIYEKMDKAGIIGYKWLGEDYPVEEGRHGKKEK